MGGSIYFTFVFLGSISVIKYSFLTELGIVIEADFGIQAEI
jgi:hypothetical protein